jgi:transcriptional regulator with XRE-family HTH domain
MQSSVGDVRLGMRLKLARLAKRLRIRDVAKKVGCSTSSISKIENDKVVPSLTMLHRLVSALNLNIGALFEQTDKSHNLISRAGRRSVIALSNDDHDFGVRLERLVPYTEGRLLQGNIHIVAPGAGSRGLIQHKGEEVGYVLKGQLDLTIAGVTYRIRAGDSFTFPSMLEHSYVNPGRTVARIVWINTPPTF